MSPSEARSEREDGLNEITIDFSDPGSIGVRFLAREPGPDVRLFTSANQVERLWEISAPLLEHPPPVEPYAPGSWTPPSIDTVDAPHRCHLPKEG
jgi:glucose-6-phosphate 1-dehydrogenase